MTIMNKKLIIEEIQRYRQLMGLNESKKIILEASTTPPKNIFDPTSMSTVLSRDLFQAELEEWAENTARLTRGSAKATYDDILELGRKLLNKTDATEGEAIEAVIKRSGSAGFSAWKGKMGEIISDNTTNKMEIEASRVAEADIRELIEMEIQSLSNKDYTLFTKSQFDDMIDVVDDFLLSVRSYTDADFGSPAIRDALATSLEDFKATLTTFRDMGGNIDASIVGKNINEFIPPKVTTTWDDVIRAAEIESGIKVSKLNSDDVNKLKRQFEDFEVDSDAAIDRLRSYFQHMQSLADGGDEAAAKQINKVKGIFGQTLDFFLGKSEERLTAKNIYKRLLGALAIGVGTWAMYKWDEWFLNLDTSVEKCLSQISGFQDLILTYATDNTSIKNWITSQFTPETVCYADFKIPEENRVTGFGKLTVVDDTSGTDASAQFTISYGMDKCIDTVLINEDTMTFRYKGGKRKCGVGVTSDVEVIDDEKEQVSCDLTVEKCNAQIAKMDAASGSKSGLTTSKVSEKCLCVINDKEYSLSDIYAE